MTQNAVPRGKHDCGGAARHGAAARLGAAWLSKRTHPHVRECVCAWVRARWIVLVSERLFALFARRRRRRRRLVARRLWRQAGIDCPDMTLHPTQTKPVDNSNTVAYFT